jgi:hypothetical protein
MTYIADVSVFQDALAELTCGELRTIHLLITLGPALHIQLHPSIARLTTFSFFVPGALPLHLPEICPTR